MALNFSKTKFMKIYSKRKYSLLDHDNIPHEDFWIEETRRRTTRLKISNCRKIFREKIEFEYYIFNVFLIAAKCILLNNCASFQHFSFKLGQIVGLV
jgi:hypothetical protein